MAFVGCGVELRTSAGAGFGLFVASMITAGTVLPLASAHRGTGMACLDPVQGRARRTALAGTGAGVSMGVGLCAYFGVGGTIAVLVGLTPGDPVEMVEMVEIGGYTVWGRALLVVSTSYHRLTKPSCPVAAATTGAPAGQM